MDIEHFLIAVIISAWTIYLTYLQLRMYDDIHEIRKYLINKEDSNENN